MRKADAAEFVYVTGLWESKWNQPNVDGEMQTSSALGVGYAMVVRFGPECPGDLVHQTIYPYVEGGPQVFTPEGETLCGDECPPATTPHEPRHSTCSWRRVCRQWLPSRPRRSAPHRRRQRPREPDQADRRAAGGSPSSRSCSPWGDTSWFEPGGLEPPPNPTPPPDGQRVSASSRSALCPRRGTARTASRPRPGPPPPADRRHGRAGASLGSPSAASPSRTRTLPALS